MSLADRDLFLRRLPLTSLLVVSEPCLFRPESSFDLERLKKLKEPLRDRVDPDSLLGTGGNSCVGGGGGGEAN